jgi:glutathione S-transferase
MNATCAATMAGGNTLHREEPMKLHFSPLSSNARRVTMTAHLLGIPLEENRVDLRDAAARARLEALNPNKKIPVLEDGDFVLWESIAIMQYLCDGTPAQTLYPTERRARADVNRWLSWSQAHWTPPIGHLGFEHVWKKFVTGGDADADQVKRHETAFQQFAAVLDGALASRRWLVGEAITLADIAVGVPLMQAAKYRLPLEPYVHVRRWYAGLTDLPAWRATEPQKQ